MGDAISDDEQEFSEETSPTMYAAQSTIAMQTTTAQFRNVDARLNVLRREAEGVNLSGLKLSVNGQMLPTQLFASFLPLNNATDTPTENIAGADFSRLGAFVNGNINIGDKDETKHEYGFEFSTLGVTGGIDYRFTDSLVAGVALGYSNNETNIDANDSNIDAHGYSISLYGTYYQTDNFYIDGLLSLGYNTYHNMPLQRECEWSFKVSPTLYSFQKNFLVRSPRFIDVNQTKVWCQNIYLEYYSLYAGKQAV